VNISHWLWQSSVRGEERESFFVEDDIRFIDSIGYDHIRLPVDEEQMWDEQGNKEPEAFSLLHKALTIAAEYNLRVIVDLHIIRSHYFNNKVRPLWTDPAEQDKFVALWRDLSAELSKYPNHMVAYELLNEAVSDDPEEWNNLVDRTVKAIRETEPERKVVIGSNMWQSVRTFDELKVPAGDTNIILSFHFYEPFVLTHHQTSWTALKPYTGPVKYPGQLIDTADLKQYGEAVYQEFMNYDLHFTPDSIDSLLQEPLAFAREHNLPLYCGEWGCYKSVDNEDMLRWYADVRQKFAKYDIPWTNWDYKGSFGIVSREGELYQDLIKVLLAEE